MFNFAAHTQATAAKVRHQDINAGNILISDEGKGLLIDWDLSCRLPDDLASSDNPDTPDDSDTPVDPRSSDDDLNSSEDLTPDNDNSSTRNDQKEQKKWRMARSPPH